MWVRGGSEPAAGAAAAATATLTAGAVSDKKMEEVMDKVWNKEVGPNELLKILNKDK